MGRVILFADLEFVVPQLAPEAAGFEQRVLIRLDVHDIDWARVASQSGLQVGDNIG